jgi:PAS domain S-box-containing protein
MTWSAILALLPYAVAFVTSLGIGIYAWHHRRVRASAAFAVVALSEAAWTAGAAIEVVAGSLEAKILWDDVQWVPAFVLASGLLAFGLHYSGTRLSRPRVLWATVVSLSALSYAVVLTDASHGLVRTSPRLVPGTPFGALHYDYGPVLWAILVLVYGQIVFGLLRLLASYVRSHQLYRSQARMVLIGASVPLVVSLLPAVGIRPTFQQDLSPYSFTFSNVLIAWGLFRFGLFDVGPLARERVVENMGDAVFALDRSERLVDANPAGLRFLASASVEVVGRRGEEVFARWPAIVAFCREECLQAEVVVEEDGWRRHLDLRTIPLFDRRQDRSGRALVIRDVTARKEVEAELRRHRDRLEELVQERTSALETANEELRREIQERTELEGQLAHSQKMEAIGRLAGGVAHDFNNLLTAILGYVDLLGAASLDTSERQFLGEIHKAADRATVLTRQLLAFSRKQVLRPEVLELGAVVNELEGMLARLVGEDIRIACRRGSPAYVKADRGQIEQVVLNLVVNARDAMESGGVITIETAEGAPEGVENPDLAGRTPGKQAVLLVQDTGAGMDEETLSRAFEPFFTTKPQGEGTGLGLSTVYGIVRQSEGRITVESAPGEGTTFRICLPWSDERPEAPRGAAPAGDSARGTETILLVEDDEILRNLAREALESRGYEVLVARQADEALGIARRYGKHIDLLFSDVVLPGAMSGADLAARLEEERPGLRSLLMSGYAAEVIDRHLRAGRGAPYLQKPFTPSGLAVAIREVLDAD